MVNMRIQAEGIYKSFFSTPALVDVTMDVAPGQIVALLGSNGCGKTTLLRCFSGLASTDRGRVLLDGEPHDRENLGQRRKLHFMPDFPALLPRESILRNLTVMLSLYGRDQPGREEEVVALLTEFELLPLIRKRVQSLSRGQAYKVSLIGLIAADPEVWLLDEPFASGMDPNGITSFRNHARAAATRGRTIVYSTQILDLAERFSDRVCLLNQGKLVAFAPLAELGMRAGATDKILPELFQQLRESK
jgi:ABC-type multidrug transport system ATPase subunit